MKTPAPHAMNTLRQTRLPLGAGEAFRATTGKLPARSARVYAFPSNGRTAPAAAARRAPVAMARRAHPAQSDAAAQALPHLRPAPEALRADLQPAPRRWIWGALALSVAMLAPLGLWATGAL